VHNNLIKRLFFTVLLKLDAVFYSNITIISESLAQKHNIIKYTLLPLGSEDFSLPPKTFSPLNLVYTGVFNQRNIHETIIGFSIFLSSKPAYKTKLFYNIYGYGDSKSEKKIKETISDWGVDNNVLLHGRFTPVELNKILNNNNIGVSYIPKTSYYNVQPPTKTFEYLLAGMPVIATSTFENAKVINSINGVLVEDDSESFAKGLELLINNIEKNDYDSRKIVKSSLNYTWQHIVDCIFKPYIDIIIRMD
jgi:glycosyltransferase involved in cell wall biosynthesis